VAIRPGEWIVPLVLASTLLGLVVSVGWPALMRYPRGIGGGVLVGLFIASVCLEMVPFDGGGFRLALLLAFTFWLLLETARCAEALGNVLGQACRSRTSLMRFAAQHSFVVLAVFVLGVLGVYLATNGRPLHWLGHDEWLFFFDRATSLASGVSPVVPILLLGLAFAWWGYIQRRRLALLEYHAQANPFPPLALFMRIAHLRHEVVKDLWAPARALASRTAWAAGVALFFAFSRLASRFVPSVDGVVVDSLLLLALAVLSVLIVAGLLHLLRIWKDLRRLLRAVALLPLEEGIKRIPHRVTTLFGPYLASERPGRREHLLYRREKQRLMAESFWAARGELRDALWFLGADEWDRLDTAMTAPAGDAPLDLAAAAQACARVLGQVWRHPDLADRLLGPGPDKTKEGAAARAWLKRAEDVVAIEAVADLSQFFVHMRNLALFLGFAPLLMLFAITMYPFQPQRLWLLLSAGLIGAVSFFVVRTICQIERDEVVSWVQQTTPNQINFHWDFFARVATYTAPLLGVLVALSPDLSDLVHVWLDPLVQLVR
jgi:hypothetical protein